MIRHYEVFIDEGPAAGRLKEKFATQAEAEKRAKEATDGRYIVYAILSDYSDEEVARGAGDLTNDPAIYALEEDPRNTGGQ